LKGQRAGGPFRYRTVYCCRSGQTAWSIKPVRDRPAPLERWPRFVAAAIVARRGAVMVANRHAGLLDR